MTAADLEYASWFEADLPAEFGYATTEELALIFGESPESARATQVRLDTILNGSQLSAV